MPAKPTTRPTSLDDPDGRKRAKAASPSRRRSTTSCRRPTLLDRGQGRPGPDMRDREATAKALLEALRHFGVEAKLLGRGERTAREPLRAPARARNQGRQGRAAARTTSPTRSPRPTSASWRRSPARRRSASRSRTSAAAWCASATSTTAGRRAPRRSPCGSARTSPVNRCGADLALMPHVAGRRHHRVRKVGLHQRDAHAPSSCTPRPTRSAWCSSTRSGSSSTTTSGCRTC